MRRRHGRMCQPRSGLHRQVGRGDPGDRDVSCNRDCLGHQRRRDLRVAARRRRPAQVDGRYANRIFASQNRVPVHFHRIETVDALPEVSAPQRDRLRGVRLQRHRLVRDRPDPPRPQRAPASRDLHPVPGEVRGDRRATTCGERRSARLGLGGSESQARQHRLLSRRPEVVYSQRPVRRTGSLQDHRARSTVHRCAAARTTLCIHPRQRRARRRAVFDRHRSAAALPVAHASSRLDQSVSRHRRRRDPDRASGSTSPGASIAVCDDLRRRPSQRQRPGLDPDDSSARPRCAVPASAASFPRPLYAPVRRHSRRAPGQAASPDVASR